ncbi:MAG: hypothetical protein CFH30_00404 [Alphaproteobacteria bacterium MarineAlpha8_Bin1]|nr:MAG: hypothetical protein CFH30_00404 [Alphaproteobacteria bacterium MarineAlpha8_Bin1]
MIKNYLIVTLLIFYFVLFTFWIMWFYKSLKKFNNKRNIYLTNISGFIIITYFISFLILKILS